MAFGYIGPERKEGDEQPYIGGKFKLRLPFLHYGIDIQSLAQGAVLACTHLGALVTMMQYLGISEDVALLAVAINGAFYLWHTSFGDPGIAGWITAGIPLYITYLVSYTEGAERMQALIAFQAILAIVFLVLGVTGIANYIIAHFPISLRSGILLAAGMASLIRIFTPTEPFLKLYPVSFTIALMFSFFILFSNRALVYRKQHSWFQWMAGWGIVPGYVIGYIVGIAVGEVAAPTMGQITEKFFIAAPFGKMIDTMSPFGVGMPGPELWIAGISMAVVAYVLAFGDMLILQSLTSEVNKARPDEHVIYSPTRNHVITAWRNILEVLYSPYVCLCGPIWAGASAVVASRAMNSSRKELDSYWAAANSFNWGALVLFMSPIVVILMPARYIGFGITLALQGYLCVYIAYEMCTNNVQRGIAGVMAGAIIAANFTHVSPILSGPSIGLAIGFFLWFILKPVSAPIKGEELKEV
ncbi:MAG: hypothetical protein JW825_00415 [Candidatus Methanofastidiosa archaeon]|nr:hypothetical protein [Candidatus Methanofastidiosa archaeon]